MNNKNKTIGIIGAMKIEVEKLKEVITVEKIEEISGIEFAVGTVYGKNVIIAVSGVGKVNAAVCTQTMILKYNPYAIINIGVAGGDDRAVSKGDVVIGESLIQHDFDTSPVGDPKCFISGIDLVNIPCDEEIADFIFNSANAIEGINVYKGVIATGDKFMNDANEVYGIADGFKALAFDMESASIGQVCHINKVKLGIIRSISDSGSGDSAEEYFEFVEKSANISIKVVCEYLKNTN